MNTVTIQGRARHYRNAGPKHAKVGAACAQNNTKILHRGWAATTYDGFWLIYGLNITQAALILLWQCESHLRKYTTPTSANPLILCRGIDRCWPYSQQPTPLTYHITAGNQRNRHHLLTRGTPLTCSPLGLTEAVLMRSGVLDRSIRGFSSEVNSGAGRSIKRTYTKHTGITMNLII